MQRPTSKWFGYKAGDVATPNCRQCGDTFETTLYASKTPGHSLYCASKCNKCRWKKRRPERERKRINAAARVAARCAPVSGEVTLFPCLEYLKEATLRQLLSAVLFRFNRDDGAYARLAMEHTDMANKLHALELVMKAKDASPFLSKETPNG